MKPPAAVWVYVCPKCGILEANRHNDFPLSCAGCYPRTSYMNAFRYVLAPVAKKATKQEKRKP